MVTYAMRLTMPERIPANQGKTTFFWTAQGVSSIESSYGPRLGGLGPVLQPNVEFVRIAGTVFAADRSTRRQGGGSDWNQREIGLVVPVTNVPRWEAVSGELSHLFGFLTGDRWSLQFVRSSPPVEPIAPHQPAPRRVVLLSGGADSAIGALLSRSKLASEESHTLVSHVGLKNLAPVQRHVAEQVESLIPGPGQQHLQIGFRRHSKQPNGVKFDDDESSSRSRSVLFIALGLAVASLDGVPLWIPENGFASLNPPLGPERRGSLSTRTTHPFFLAELRRILTAVGAHADIVNPLADMTKGEMFTMAAELTGASEAGTFLSSTHSCGLTGQRAFSISPAKQCGVCFGCVVRRASFVAAGLSDSTDYISPSSIERVAAWLARNSVERSVQDLVRRGIRSQDITTLNLPSDYSVAQALDLCRRQLVELAGLFP
jgi:7-cyano-7-deazaguanine synthase in queuosine biosynthesis